jgi:protein SCO1/2
VKRLWPIAYWLVLAVGALHAEPWSAATAPGVAFEQRLGATLPLATPLRDETGARVRLADFFGRRPVVLVFGYTRCPQLCAVVAEGAVEALRGVAARVGRDFDVLYVSIDPGDGPRELAALRERDVRRYGRSGAGEGWHAVAGERSAIATLAAAAGFRFTYDPRSKLYAHASGFLVVTADGRIARYFPGIDFSPREIAAALARAGKGEIGAPAFDLLLLCARGLGVAGRYGALIWTTLMIAVAATIVAVAGGIAWMLRAERRAAGEVKPCRPQEHAR